MHPAAFYFSCTYTNGISLRIIIKDYIITQTEINKTALNCGLNFVCNCKPKTAILIFFDFCSVLKITENQHWYIGPCYLHICCIATSYCLPIQHIMRWPHFDVFRKIPKEHFLIQIYNRFIVGGLCINRKDIKHLNNFSRCIKIIENII